MSKMEKMKITIEETRVSLSKGTETIGLDITGNDVHIWATDKSGGRTIANLRFAKDEIVTQPLHKSSLSTK